MRQYRVVEKMDKDGHLCYAIQRKGWFFWRHAHKEWSPWGSTNKVVYTKEHAIRLISYKIEDEEQNNAIAKKRAAHKNKVVYGPYPP